MTAPAAGDRHREYITGAILAGGRARRMGGQDKGLVEIAGRAMVTYVADALRPQVAALVVNANRNIPHYAQLCRSEVVPDSVDGYAGPLAGMASVMHAAPTPMLLSVPCDCPLVGPDLALRLWRALTEAGAEVAVAHDGERLQPVFALLRCELAGSIVDYLQAGERKIDRWYAGRNMVAVDFSDRPDTFWNVNTPQEAEALAARMREAADGRGAAGQP